MFKYLSKDGEEGFPGTVEMRLWYMPSIEKIDGVEKTSLEIEYEAELVGDEVEETVIALTNHRYVVALDNFFDYLANNYLPATSTSPAALRSKAHA